MKKEEEGEEKAEGGMKNNKRGRTSRPVQTLDAIYLYMGIFKNFHLGTTFYAR